jgi:hypothetical protein
VGLYKLNAVYTHSLKAPGFSPCAYTVISCFQSLLANATCAATLREASYGVNAQAARAEAAEAEASGAKRDLEEARTDAAVARADLSAARREANSQSERADGAEAGLYSLFLLFAHSVPGTHPLNLTCDFLVSQNLLSQMDQRVRHYAEAEAAVAAEEAKASKLRHSAARESHAAAREEADAASARVDALERDLARLAVDSERRIMEGAGVEMSLRQELGGRGLQSSTL